MNAGRTTKQGQQVSSGKFLDDYKATVSTMIMHPDDMKEIGVPNGSTVRVRSLWGEETFKCVEGKTPSGMIFIPYGPPTCRLMGQYTDGTGMPLSKGWEVEVELLSPPASGSVVTAPEE
jgi:formylmethanofuran dehydrogenase subunit D